MNSAQYKILVVPNEDGMGPSALVSYIVKALLSKEPHLQITIWNESRFRYNQSLYEAHIANGNVRVLAVWNIIQLDKPSGEVSIPSTLRRIGDYRSLSNQYPFGVQSHSFDLVLDFGVPAAARWAAKNGIRSVSVFDHSWSKTLQMILEDEDKFYPGIPRSSDAFRIEWHKTIQEIKQDEALTQQLFIFPHFIAPDVFRQHWEKIIGRNRVHQFEAVLGGCPKWTSIEAKAFLRLEKPGDTILIQGGDTPVWDNVLRSIVMAFVEADIQNELEHQNLNVVINIPDRLASQSDIAGALDNPRVTRVRRLGFVPGGTIQELLPAINFLVTRAGGGSVNDAVACRVPFVCVREPTQSQVEEILRACVERDLTRAIEPEEFERRPKEIILSQFRMRDENNRIVANMRNIPNQGEQVIAEMMLGLLHIE